MRKLLYFAALGIFSLTACGKEDNSNPSLDGTWRVMHFIDSGKDETSQFKDYTFEFRNDKTFVAKTSAKTIMGTWNETDSGKKFDIKVAGEQVLDDVADEWVVVEKTSSSLKLKDDNSSSDEELHFVKK